VCSSITPAPHSAAASICSGTGSMNKATRMPLAFSRAQATPERLGRAAHVEATLGGQFGAPLGTRQQSAGWISQAERQHRFGGRHFQVHPASSAGSAARVRRAPGCGADPRAGAG